MAFIGNISVGTGFFPKGFFNRVFAPLGNAGGGTASNTANITQDADAGADGTATNTVTLDQDATAGTGGTATNNATIDQNAVGGTATNTVNLDQDATTGNAGGSTGGTGGSGGGSGNSGGSGSAHVPFPRFRPFSGTFVSLRNLGVGIFQSNAQLQKLFQIGFASSGGNVSNTATQNADADFSADVDVNINITI